MKEKVLIFLRRIFKIHSPSEHALGTCMTCKHGDLGPTEGPCRDCYVTANGLCNYDDGERKYSPIQKAYDILVAARDEEDFDAVDVDELIGYLGEALDN